MIELLVLIFIGAIIWMLLGPIIIGVLVIGAALVALVLVSLGLYCLVVTFKLIKDGLTLRSAQKTLTKLTAAESLATLTVEQKRALGALIEQYKAGKQINKKNLQEVGLWTALGYTVADMGASKALRYSLGYYGLRKIVRDKFTKED